MIILALMKIFSLNILKGKHRHWIKTDILIWTLHPEKSSQSKFVIKTLSEIKNNDMLACFYKVRDRILMILYFSTQLTSFPAIERLSEATLVAVGSDNSLGLIGISVVTVGSCLDRDWFWWIRWTWFLHL